MSTAASKSPITHPVAKRFMVVFGAIALIGLFTAPVFRNDFLFILLTVGSVGFMASAFFAADRKIDEDARPAPSGRFSTSNPAN
jgi:hypothetical protein